MADIDPREPRGLVHLDNGQPIVFAQPEQAETPPADGDLRDRYAQALMAAFDKTAIVCDHTQVVQFGPLADAALAVRDDEVEQLRGELAEYVVIADEATVSANMKIAQLERRAEQAEEAAAEWQAACEAHQRDGEALMAAIERVRALAERWENALAPDRPYARSLRAALDAPSGADSPADAGQIIDERPTGVHAFKQNPAATQVSVCICGLWRDHHVHGADPCGCDACRTPGNAVEATDGR